VAFHPAHQRWPNIKAERLKVVDNLHYFALVVKNAGERIGAIALLVNALVPVVAGSSTGLALDSIEIRIFAGRLVEMPVHRHINPCRCFEGIRLKGIGGYGAFCGDLSWSDPFRSWFKFLRY